MHRLVTPGTVLRWHRRCAITLQRLYCPRANAHAERFVLTARTEVTDRMLILGERPVGVNRQG